MKHLLYIGNHLKNGLSNPSMMATLGPLLAGEGYGVRYASSQRYMVLRLLDMLVSVFRYRHEVEIVLIDTYSTWNFYYAVLVARLCRVLKIPYVPILHGGNLPHRLKHSPKLCKALFENAKVNVSPSPYLKTVFNQHGHKNVVTIPNPLSIARYAFSQKDFAVPKLLWVRSFAAIYNPTLAVEVLRLLRDRGYPAELCMVGPDADGSLSKVKALAKQLGVHVTFTGKLSKDAWIARSKDYNIVINTTDFDNMPLSILEAMALGFPVVSTNVGGMPYLITHDINGLLVPPRDPEAMSHAIISLLNHTDKRQQLITQARTLAETFDWHQVKGKWRDVLED